MISFGSMHRRYFLEENDPNVEEDELHVGKR